ncbi:hypothetical protein ElyMa_005545500 [Elysia marginata]|uniref:Uncharacterized protein n=1 Tax=Elysia marginata TaxID=1093978 RepID=A0AAV4EXW5_9GAST|nr:hypothetical protein ElyMa_005545500 [Elysia marginata]
MSTGVDSIPSDVLNNSLETRDDSTPLELKTLDDKIEMERVGSEEEKSNETTDVSWDALIDPRTLEVVVASTESEAFELDVLMRFKSWATSLYLLRVAFGDNIAWRAFVGSVGGVGKVLAFLLP